MSKLLQSFYDNLYAVWSVTSDPLQAGLVTAVVLAGALIVTWLGGLVVGRLLRPFAGELERVLDARDETSKERGFAQGGAWIGYLERFLIYLFVISGQLAAVGFLVAAKSIFRFGELSDRANRLEAEYITIGTLLSFAWGLTASMLTKLLLEQLTT